MSAITIAVAVAVDTIARFELPLLAGIIGYCPVGACVSLQALCVPKQAKGFPKEKIRRSTRAQARPTVLPNRSNFSNSVVRPRRRRSRARSVTKDAPVLVHGRPVDLPVSVIVTS